jgi:hypothetical protein
MLPVHRRFLLAVAAVGHAFPAAPSPSGAIREDVPDSLYRALGAQSDFRVVGIIRHRDKPAGTGSGVLVAASWVLTDAHVVAESQTERAGAATTAPGKLTFEIQGRVVAISEVVVHPDYFGAQFAGARDMLARKGIDLALLRLAAPIVDVPPARLYRGMGEAGHTMAMIGYGTFGTSQSAISRPEPPGTKRGGTNVIDQIGGKVKSRDIPAHYLVTDFDSPRNPSLNVTGDASPTRLEYLPLGGDSGGGGFIQVDGVWYLACAFATSTIAINDDPADGLYGTVSYCTRLSAFASWIDEIARRP